VHVGLLKNVENILGLTKGKPSLMLMSFNTQEIAQGSEVLQRK